VDLGTLISARQPFAAKSRVKFEEVAQQYGDKLYEGKFDLRSVRAPAAAGRASAPSEGIPMHSSLHRRHKSDPALSAGRP
jgi:hypothetical protein